MDAYELFQAADEREPLEPDDLERFATTAHLLGKDEESAEAWARAHRDLLSLGRVERAARCAFWLGLGLMFRGDQARGAGWIGRAGTLLEDVEDDCAEQGYLLLPAALRSLAQGDNASAYETSARAVEIGGRFGEPDLVVLGRLGRGQSLIRSGDVVEGVALLDEVMVAVETDDISPMVVGIVYCAVIETCQEVFDMRRAHEWTAALSGWCEAQPELVPYRGQCLVRRSEIMQLHGAWGDALVEARRACDRLTAPPGEPAAGAAFYQRAEIHRLRGEFEEAEDAYREATRWGRKAQPGLARLRLAQGQVDAAIASIRRVMDETRDRRTRSRVLPACVEIMLAAGDVDAAGEAADELEDIAAELDAPLLRAVAAGARGEVRLARGDARAALDALRDAWRGWEELEAPYEAARVRVLIGIACGELGDDDTAELELDAARWAFEQLGAAPDLARLDELTRRGGSRAGAGPGASHGLTPREIQVLRRVAAGATNKAIAAELFISERTVERHVSNMFTKLQVSSRSAATAYAYEHQLV